MAGIDLFEGFIKLRADDREFQSDIRKIAGVAAGIAGAAFVFKFATEGLDEVKEAQKVQAQTEAAIKSTGGAAGVTADQVHDLAGKMMDLSGADDEAVQGAENLLLRLANIKDVGGQGADVFEHATKITSDLSVAMGRDLSSSATVLGKALSDPIAGLAALGRIGVRFTEDQKATIKSLVDSGKTLEAQTFILDALEKKVGGAAEAYGQTLPGKIDKAKETIHNFEGEVVGAAAPALEKLTDLAIPLVHAFESIPQPVQAIVVALGGIAFLAGPVTKGIEGISKVASAASSAFDTMRLQALYLADVGFAKLALSAGAVGAAIAVGTIAFQAWRTEQARTQEETEQYTAAIEKQTDSLNENVDAVTRKHLADSDIGHVLREAGADQEIFTKAIRESDPALDGLRHTLANGSNAMIAFRQGMKDGSIQSTDLTRELLRLVESGKLTAGQYQQVVGILSELSGAYKDGTDKAKDKAYFDKKAADASGAVADAADDQKTSLDELNKSLEKNKKAEDDVVKALSDHYKLLVDTGQANISYERAQLDVNKQIADTTAILKDGTKSADDRKRSVLDLADSFRRQADAAVQDAENQAQLNGKTLDGSEKAAIYRDEMGKLEGKVPGLRGQIQNLTGDLNNIPARKDVEVAVKIVSDIQEKLSAENIQNQFNKFFGGGGNQGGGRITSHDVGVPRPVGEGGPEIFVPDQPGSILANGQAKTDAGGGFTWHGDLVLQGYGQHSPSAGEIVDTLRTAAFLGGVNPDTMGRN